MSENGIVGEGGSRVVTVKLGPETFALPIELIEGIVPWEPLTRVPRMPSFVAGVFQVRGRVLPVIDLRARLGMQVADEAGTHRRIVIVQYGQEWVGYIVDSVSEVRWIPASAVTDDVPVVATCGEQFIAGIAQIGTDLVILLRAEKLLTGDEHKRAIRLAKHEPISTDKAA